MDKSVSPSPNSGKIFYINNIKVILTALVVLHHAAVTYGAPGGWYYQQKAQSKAVLFPLTLFVATNQSFFMGFFFFLSALFVESSYQRKGANRFVADRLKRLGIPLLFYSFILSPVMNYFVERFGNGGQYSFASYLSGYHDWIDFGVLWFAAALLIFNLIYVLMAKYGFSGWKWTFPLPSNRALVFSALGLGVITFLTRLIFPVGWTLDPLGFQLGHFPQYILLFLAGLVAHKNHWLEQTTLKQGKVMAIGSRLMVLVVLPIIFIITLVWKIPIQNFSGGPNLISAIYSLWEMTTGIMIISAFLCIGKFKMNGYSARLNDLSQESFGVYIFHPVLLISLSLAVRLWDVDPGVKFLIVGPLAVVSTFLFVFLIRKIPLVRSII
jgi:surface polysaccharide O-acyltransferase-like enzyme